MAEKELAWATRAGNPTCRSTCINLLFGFFENLSQNLFLYMYLDLHVGFPAQAAQADSFSAARTPRVLALVR